MKPEVGKICFYSTSDNLMGLEHPSNSDLIISVGLNNFEGLNIFFIASSEKALNIKSIHKNKKFF